MYSLSILARKDQLYIIHVQVTWVIYVQLVDLLVSSPQRD